MNKFMMGKTFYHYEVMRAAANGEPVMPVSCEIDVSNVCDLDCSFCMFEDFRSKVSAMLEWQLYSSLVFQLRDVGCRSVTFTGGGEPLMHPKFDQMSILAYRSGLDVGLVTNGISLYKLSNPRIFKFIRVSLDASNPETYKIIKGRDKFDRVIQGIKHVKRNGAFVGLSYVVCEENRDGIKEAQELANELEVEYIQFKPAYIQNGGSYEDYEMPTDVGKIINTERFIAKDRLPCKMAGLVGIVTADANVCFCCQYRGQLIAGSLESETFKELWQRRHRMRPDITKCPPCRYMSYVNAYEIFRDKYSFMFWEHKDFL